jgi:hypothetical protein
MLKNLLFMFQIGENSNQKHYTLLFFQSVSNSLPISLDYHTTLQQGQIAQIEYINLKAFYYFCRANC